MHVAALIPARYGSTRLPGKALARQTGKFLIQHVFERVAAAKRVERCIVATDDERIVAAVRSFGGQAVMTRAEHPSGTDRIAEVVRGMPGAPEDIVLNVQGDEPEIEPAYLDRLVDRLAAAAPAEVPAATLACPFPAESDPRDPNCVKVVTDRAGNALYFSRALIPYPHRAATGGRGDWLLHLGVYAFRRAFLLELAGLPAGRLERAEQLEQLRALEHARAMAVEVVERAWAGVDTPADYARFVARMKGQTAG